MSKFTTYKYKGLKGVVGDLVTEWMTDEESKSFWKEHNKYIEELKSKGEYLQPYEIDIKMEHDPLYDSKHKKGNGCESYKFDILDLTNIEPIKPFKTSKEHLDSWKKFNPNNNPYQN